MKKLQILGLCALLSLAALADPESPPDHPPVPETFRGSSQAEKASLGDLQWFQVFHDPKLQELIRVALKENADLRLAIARVDQARANLGVQSAEQLPKLSLTADLNQTLASTNSPTFIAGFIPRNRPFGEVLLNFLSYELDIWGRVRHQTQAAAAQLLATEADRRTVMSMVVAEVATTYFNLLDLDAELDLARRTLKTRTDSLEIIKIREQGGVATMLDVRQAEQLVQTAALAIPETERQVAGLENQLHLLLGQTPGPVERGVSLLDQDRLPEVPAGLTSDLLVRRPDIVAAELNLQVQKELVEVARASFFPRITLTGFLGFQSRSLSNLFSTGSQTFFLNPSITQPIYSAGLGSAEDLAESQRETARIRYQQVILVAFREVSDALLQYGKIKEIRAGREALVATLQHRVELAYLRYKGGVDTLLPALDADRDLFNAQLTLVQARRNELLSVVQLYKALGGGWQPEAQMEMVPAAPKAED
jgi:outer membrane protein, multidrug efflux system